MTKFEKIFNKDVYALIITLLVYLFRQSDCKGVISKGGSSAKSNSNNNNKLNNLYNSGGDSGFYSQESGNFFDAASEFSRL